LISLKSVSKELRNLGGVIILSFSCCLCSYVEIYVPVKWTSLPLLWDGFHIKSCVSYFCIAMAKILKIKKPKGRGIYFGSWGLSPWLLGLQQNMANIGQSISLASLPFLNTWCIKKYDLKLSMPKNVPVSTCDNKSFLYENVWVSPIKTPCFLCPGRHSLRILSSVLLTCYK
jgi:hypothetical protein